MSCSCGFKSLLKHVLVLLHNRIWIRTFRTFCPICVQFDVRNLQNFLFLSPFTLSSPARTFSWCPLPSVSPMSFLCAAILTYSTPSCKPINLNCPLNSDTEQHYVRNKENDRFTNFPFTVVVLFVLFFALCYFYGNRILNCLIDFEKFCAPIIYVKKRRAHLQLQYFQRHLLAEVLLVYLVFLGKRLDRTCRICMIALCHFTVSAVRSVQ